MHLEGTDRPFSEDEVARIRNAIPGTRSQQVIYRDSEGYDVAIVHQFLRPDGLLAGFERPDPTHLYVDGIHYRRMKNEPSYDKEPSSD